MIKNCYFITKLNMYFSLLLKLGLSLIDFAAQRDYYILKYKQIMIVYNIKDIERYIYYKGEDKKYNIILINKSYKNKLKRTKREIENNELRDIKKMIKDKELISNQK